MAIKQKANAVAYFRTSTDTNIGAGKDTLLRQREAVARAGVFALWAVCAFTLFNALYWWCVLSGVSASGADAACIPPPLAYRRRGDFTRSTQDRS